MRRSDFRYDLPPELIAQLPLPERTASRLLYLDGDARQDLAMRDLPGLLDPGDLLVFNDTRVMPARLHARKDTGGRAEILIERLLAGGRALAQVRASKSPRPGSVLLVADEVLRVEAREGDLFRLVCADGDWQRLMASHGHVPLPPYIRRDAERLDTERYQTVYATHPGAVAAPTAGLHFDQALLDSLKRRGIRTGRVTLHVGAGTFQPVRTEDLDRHVMHSEWLQVDERICDQVAETRRRGGRVLAVGTTTVRSLETAAASGELRPFQGETRLFIRPGFVFRAVDLLLTNFHLPESTLLMLVCAFGGYDQVMAAYQHAVARRYRFFSYGDAMLLVGAR